MASTNPLADIHRLAELIAARNDWEREITAITGRPALVAPLGETIAARIFNIRLDPPAVHKAGDGVFADGPLAGRPVNIDWYPAHEYRLDLAPGFPDFYLVLSGPPLPEGQRRAETGPWLVVAAYLFNSARLLDQLNDVQLDITVPLEPALWRAAELYPVSRCPDYTLTADQRARLDLFSSVGL